MDAEGVHFAVIQVRYRVARGRRAGPGDGDYRPLPVADLAIVQDVPVDGGIARVVPGQGYLPVSRHRPQADRPVQPIRRRGGEGYRPVAVAIAVDRANAELVLGSVIQPDYGVHGGAGYFSSDGPPFAGFALLQMVPGDGIVFRVIPAQSYLPVAGGGLQIGRPGRPGRAGGRGRIRRRIGRGGGIRWGRGGRVGALGLDLHSRLQPQDSQKQQGCHNQAYPNQV